MIQDAIFISGLIHLLERQFNRPEGAKELRALRSALLKAKGGEG